MKTPPIPRFLRRYLGGLLGAAALASHAQTYSIDWFKVAGGGGTSSNGTYALSGTIGQHDASQAPMIGGNYSLTGGFWALYAVQTPGAPYLTVILTTTNTVLVTWPSPSTGYTLQGNSALGNTNWQNVTNTQTVVNGQIQVIVAPPVGDQFYRLKNP